MAILIDGFNLIYKFPDLEKLMYIGKLSEARTGLLNKLKEYQNITKAKIRIVFDGKKEQAYDIKSETIKSIDVFYSLDYSADFLIKQFIKKDINPRMTTVVTSDKDIIDFVTRFKTKVKTSEEFYFHLCDTIDNNKSIEPEKDENPMLSDEEVTYWEKKFIDKI
jgi:uncharacterized protein